MQSILVSVSNDLGLTSGQLERFQEYHPKQPKNFITYCQVITDYLTVVALPTTYQSALESCIELIVLAKKKASEFLSIQEAALIEQAEYAWQQIVSLGKAALEKLATELRDSQ